MNSNSVFIDFERTPRRRLSDLNLTPLIDILFILIIFFMLTTSFMRVESMELILPSAAGKAADKNDVVRLFLHANGDMAVGQRKVDNDEFSETFARLLGPDGNTRIMLVTADGVTMQQLVSMMDRIYLAGGKSMFVRKWDSAPEEATKPAQPVELKMDKIEKKPAAPLSLKQKFDIRDLWGE